MSNFSRTKLFWQGTLGCNAARVATKQSQEQIQARMGRDRVEARYKELKENAERGMAGTEALGKGSPDMRSGKSS
jgi:hypothetical protein